MKRMLLFCGVVLLFAVGTATALTYDLAAYQRIRSSDLSRTPADFFYQFVSEVEGQLEGTTGWTGASLYVVPQSATPSETDEGRIHYDSDDDNLYVYSNGGWVDLTAGAGNPAGADTQMQYNNAGAFGAIATIIWDDTNLEFADDQKLAFGTNADWTVEFDDAVDDQLIFLTAATGATATTDPLYEIIVGGSPTADQQVFGVAKGTQASNTALLTLDEDGDLVLAGSFSAGSLVGDVTLSSGETITNTTDTEIAFAQNAGEDIVFDMDAGANAVGLASNTGVDELQMGDVDDLTGIGTLVFDQEASTITLTSNGAGDDLTMALAGATDSSLKFTSTGTAGDAISLVTSAGGLDLTVAGAAAGEDLDLTSNTSIRAIASEAAADDAVVIQAAGAGSGIQITSLADIDIITTGEAGEDILITNTGGSVAITANENDADVIAIQTSGGGGTSESINILNDQGTAESALDIDATAGGIDIDFATAKNMAIDGGQFIFTSNEAVAGAFTVTANTGGAETIVITNTQGTDEAAINLDATAGGIDIDFATAKNFAATGGQFLFTSNEAVASAFNVTTNTGAAETIVFTNTQGNTAAAITATATAGGITLDASSGVVFTQGQTRHQTFDMAAVTLDGTAPPTLVEIGTDGQAQWAALSFDADGGITGDDIAYITWLVPDGYVVDSARLNIGYSFSTAEDAADEAQFDFTVNAVGQNEAIDVAGTALADQTTVIADASTDNGNNHVSQYNIEVEAIAVDDVVHIQILVDEGASELTASGTLDVHYLDIEWESTE